MAAAIGYVRGMFQWTVKREGIIAPDERPPAGQSVALGIQHIFAMFGATVLAPVIMGFNPNTAIFFSGIGTLIFFVFVRGRVPSYLGSSFSFIAVVISAEAIGGLFGYLLYGLLSNILHFGGPYIDLNSIGNAPLIGWPALTAPQFDMHAVTLIVPVAIVLVAENLGHIKAVATMTGRDLDPYIGRAFFADGVATIVAGSGGGTGVTTYAENIGVMAVTKTYSSLVFVIAACVAILLGFSPMFGALVLSIPQAVLGGMAIVLFGLIATTGARIWVENKVDFTDNKNFITAAVALTMGAGNLVITQGDFSIGGIGTACIGALLIYQILNRFGMGAKAEPAAEAPAA